MTREVENYQAGAWTALTKMAQLGANRELILSTVASMELSLDYIDAYDHIALTEIIGRIPTDG